MFMVVISPQGPLGTESRFTADLIIFPQSLPFLQHFPLLGMAPSQPGTQTRTPGVSPGASCHLLLHIRSQTKTVQFGSLKFL